MAFALPEQGDAARSLLTKLTGEFLSPGSALWWPTLLSALGIAVAVSVWPRLRKGRPVAPAALMRALFPRRLVGASSRADVGLFLFNTFAAGILIGWALISMHQISRPVADLLVRVFGPAPALAMDPSVSRAIVTMTLFVAYEFAYWLDHSLSHRIPFLWAFHKVHHTAQTLTPLTLFRVHPVDSLVFANIVAVVVGSAIGVTHYLFGAAASPFTISGANVILTVFVFLTVHLQHSHVWISFTGIWGRIFLSPAHHQIHHSADPRHFNKNFGSCLSLWDWLFGTLYLPTARREVLTYGAGAPGEMARAHSVTGVLITPFVDSVRGLGAWMAGRRKARAGSGEGALAN